MGDLSLGAGIGHYSSPGPGRKDPLKEENHRGAETQRRDEEIIKKRNNIIITININPLIL